jgi:hypothetical protein
MSETTTVRALEGFTAPGRRRVSAGEEFAIDDPIVVGREHLFSAPDAALAPKRAPGARPGSKSRATKAPAKKAARARKAPAKAS